MPSGTFTRVQRSGEPAPSTTRPLGASSPASASGGSHAIEVRGLRKQYATKVALDGVSFSVNRGEVFGFLGPNGAGKTTTIRILTGLLRPTEGQAWILGEPVGPERTAAKAMIGYVPDEPAFPAGLKALPLLVAYSRFHGIPRKQAEAKGLELLKTVGLEGQEKARIKTFSHGMTKRYALAQALLHDPPLLIMDEPTSGLDPAGTAWFRDFLRFLRDQGKTVFLSSHLLHEVQQVCDRVGIIHDGRIKAVDTIASLAGSVQQGAEILIEARPLPADAPSWVKAVPGVLAVRRDGDALHVDAERVEVAIEVNAALVQRGVRVVRLEPSRPSLEDIFLSVTKEDGA